jgi:hypothetical protein
MENLTNEQIDLISHSLGINYHHCKNSKRAKDSCLPNEFYRKYYNYGVFSEDMIILESMGLIERFEHNRLGYFGVTKKGIDLFRQIFFENITLNFEHISKSKIRYQEYVDSDCGVSFSEWMGIELPKIEHLQVEYNLLLVRFYKKYPKKYHSYEKYEVSGFWCNTLKGAKASYKQALKQYKSNFRKNK